MAESDPISGPMPAFFAADGGGAILAFSSADRGCSNGAYMSEPAHG
jgi:hypothetical protein